MKNTTLLLTIFFVSIRFLSFSQNEIPAQWCGTPDFTAEMMDKVQSATERYMNGTLTKSNMPYNIPITLHNMRNSDGSGGVDMAATFEEFCKAIEFYVQHDINLYIHDIKTHDNSGWTDGDPRDTGAWGTITFLTIDEESENTINIYGFEDLPGTCGYFQPSNDIIAFNCIGWTTIVHELGHYFALPHTFLGIDGGANCGVYVSNGEKVDGSNCATAADRICDTPPDNNTVRTPCSNGMGCQMLDSDSTAFFPDVTNIMSYFNFECRNKFTEGQRAVMHNKIEQDHTNLLVTDLPNTNPVTEATELIFPLNTETPYDQVLFTWNAVENANLYQIEINRLPNFSPSFIVETAFIEETQYNISNPLAPNITYYWRVLPLNKANPCTTGFVSGSFMTNDQAVSTQGVESVRSFEISPNPADNDQLLTLSLNSTKPMPGQLNLYNVSGQHIYSETIQVAASSNTLNLDIKELRAGLYIIQLEFTEGTVQHKLIIH